MLTSAEVGQQAVTWLPQPWPTVKMLAGNVRSARQRMLLTDRDQAVEAGDEAVTGASVAAGHGVAVAADLGRGGGGTRLRSARSSHGGDGEDGEDESLDEGHFVDFGWCLKDDCWALKSECGSCCWKWKLLDDDERS